MSAKNDDREIGASEAGRKAWSTPVVITSVNARDAKANLKGFDPGDYTTSSFNDTFGS